MTACWTRRTKILGHLDKLCIPYKWPLRDIDVKSKLITNYRLGSGCSQLYFVTVHSGSRTAKVKGNTTSTGRDSMEDEPH